MEKTKWIRLYMICKGCKRPFIYKNRTICEHCKEANYCSIECYLHDKISHKKECKGIGQEALMTLNAGPDISKVVSREKWLIQKVSDVSEGSFMLCLKCDKKCVENVMCHKCRSVFYCSRDCFEKDWPDHCLRCGLVSLFHYVDESLFHGQTYEMIKKKGFSENLFVSPFMDSLHHEFAPAMFTGLKFERAVNMLQIVAPYPHSWRFAVLARDIRGITIHIIFHDEQKTEASMTGGPNLEPHVVTMVPLASCLKPVNFIILLDAWLHTFQDFTTGIRIDSLEKVHFVWKD